jgi:predicted DNA-binding antitoxin AbrB/MazE fold protein
MMIKAIYENGGFKPHEHVDLEELTQVEVSIPSSEASALSLVITKGSALEIP